MLADASPRTPPRGPHCPGVVACPAQPQWYRLLLPMAGLWVGPGMEARLRGRPPEEKGQETEQEMEMRKKEWAHQEEDQENRALLRSGRPGAADRAFRFLSRVRGLLA